jgi:hypothetical protein
MILKTKGDGFPKEKGDDLNLLTWFSANHALRLSVSFCEWFYNFPYVGVFKRERR